MLFHRLMKTIPHSPEALESRIAPAQYFLGVNVFDVVDKDEVSVNDTASAALVGADLAVLLKAGDTLIFDTNANHVFDTGEVVFAKVTGGSALVFAKNIDMDTTVDPDEMTSLAVSDGFNGAIDGSLRGSVVTSLPMSGTFDPTKLLDASIAGFTITGRMHGSILAGKNISNVQVETDFQAVAGLSLEGLRCGTAAHGQTVSYDAGATTKTLAFTLTKEGEAGGNITNVTLGHGATDILAGAGNSSKVGNAGNGGTITGLTFVTYEPTAPTIDLHIYAGNGGQSFGSDGLPPNPKGNGGKGGSVSKVTFESSYAGTGEIIFRGGDGGVGKKAGAGGAVTGGSYHFFNDSTLDVTISGGDGGKDSGSTTVKAPGGKGGAVSDQHFIAANKLGIIKFAGGNGYKGTVNGVGGSGGAVSKIEVMALAGAQEFLIDAGDGGNGAGKAPGGKGGAVSALDLELGGITDDVRVFGGRGGSNPAKGGAAGGGISDVTMTVGGTGGTLEVKGGAGGFGANGAVGGALTKITADLGPVQSYATFMAGNGGPSKSTATTGLSGGTGGSIKNLTVTDHGSLLGSGINILSGIGGDVLGGSGNGGKGGAISGVVLKKTGGGLTENAVIVGNGGDGSGKGNGGNGGKLSGVTYEGTAAAALLHIGANNPVGDSGISGLRAGNGSSVNKVTVKADAHPFTTGVFIDAGGGGAAQGPGGRGGHAGSVKTITLDVPGSAVRINANPAFPSPLEGGLGGSGAKAVGGTGGDVSGITGRVGLLVIDALAGGDSAGKGGRGGNISGVNLTEVTTFVRQIRAGDGGSAPTPGRGGNISGITVPGDIGDFTALFDTDHKATSGMGGLLAGQGGGGSGPIDPKLNGTITGVSATRIAAILAGDCASGSLENDNAVSKISKITATTIGAEPVLTPGFDFTDNDGDMVFQLGDDDTALDGLVIVLAGKSTLPVTPLKLIEV